MLIVMLLYIHVPFCRRKCHYCAFSSQAHIPELEQIYLEALKKEALLRGDQIRGKTVTSIYLGGGTPTLLSASALAGIINLAAASFSLAGGLELSIEANPETIEDKSYPSALKKTGVNRVSLGVQSLDDEALTSLGRGHSSGQALRAARIVRQAGIDNLSIDLIWGLPGQTLRKWIDDLKTVAGLGPKHLSCYGLTLEPGTPLAQKVENNEIQLPDESTQSRMYIHGAEFLESEGILQYEVSNFARMGYSCMHNIGYWEGKQFLGLGPSAVSSVNGVRWMNPSNVKDYARLADSSFMTLDAEKIKDPEMINEQIMLALRTSKGLKLSDYRLLTGHDFYPRHRSLIRALHKNHLVRMANGYLRLTKNGMLVSNSIIERFIS